MKAVGRQAVMQIIMPFEGFLKKSPKELLHNLSKNFAAISDSFTKQQEKQIYQTERLVKL